MTLQQLAAVLAVLTPLIVLVFRLSTVVNKLEDALSRVKELEARLATINAIEKAHALLDQRVGQIERWKEAAENTTPMHGSQPPRFQR